MIHSFIRRTAVATGCAVLLALPATHAGAAGARAPRWLSVNAASHTATLTLIAAYNGALGGFNFNGYGNGRMIVSVPSGYKVKVIFSNKATATPHSALVTAYSKRNSTVLPPAAFKGAYSPNPLVGIMGSHAPQVFTFTAGKAGTYAIICAVPGHDVAGMWDKLVVTHGGKATIKTS